MNPSIWNYAGVQFVCDYQPVIGFFSYCFQAREALTLTSKE
jgi:hypothetical protein